MGQVQAGQRAMSGTPAGKGEKQTVLPLTGRCWQFRPNRWDASSKAWVEADGGEAEKAPRLEGKTLTVVSYNVWFGRQAMAERMKALGELINAEKPDIVALQEVTPHINQLLLAQEWTHRYYVSDPAGKELNRYGVMLMSRLPLTDLGLRNFESNMGRKALIGVLTLPDDSLLAVGTFHLESFPRDKPIRLRQLDLYRQLVQGFPRVILCGDTNFTSESEDEVLGTDFKDAWRELHQAGGTEEGTKATPGITFCGRTNLMTRATGVYNTARLDRLFYTHRNLRPVEMRIIGTEPIKGLEKENIWPSDHYGIVTRLEILPVAAADVDGTPTADATTSKAGEEEQRAG